MTINLLLSVRLNILTDNTAANYYYCVHTGRRHEAATAAAAAAAHCTATDAAF